MELRNIPIQSDQNNQITTLDQILDQKYGERGVVNREHWEQEFEAFYSNVLLESAVDNLYEEKPRVHIT